MTGTRPYAPGRSRPPALSATRNTSRYARCRAPPARCCRTCRRPSAPARTGARERHDSSTTGANAPGTAAEAATAVLSRSPVPAVEHEPEACSRRRCRARSRTGRRSIRFAALTIQRTCGRAPRARRRRRTTRRTVGQQVRTRQRPDVRQMPRTSDHFSDCVEIRSTNGSIRCSWTAAPVSPASRSTRPPRASSRSPRSRPRPTRRTAGQRAARRRRAA